MIAHVEKFREREIDATWKAEYREIAIVSDFDADRSISSVVWSHRWPDTWYVWSVDTHEDYRRRGLASACMVELMRRARSLGVTTIRLHSVREAIPFYRSLGFTAPYGLNGHATIMEISL